MEICIQEIIDHCVKLAILQTLIGNPCRVIWMPPRSATDDCRGIFALVPVQPETSSQTPWWEEV